MNKVKIELNSAGVRQILQSQWIAEICKELANDVANKCGDGYEISTYVGKNRVNVSVYADTYEARKDNLKNNTILHALGGGER